MQFQMVLFKNLFKWQLCLLLLFIKGLPSTWDRPTTFTPRWWRCLLEYFTSTQNLYSSDSRMDCRHSSITTNPQTSKTVRVAGWLGLSKGMDNIHHSREIHPPHSWQVMYENTTWKCNREKVCDTTDRRQLGSLGMPQIKMR